MIRLLSNVATPANSRWLVLGLVGVFLILYVQFTLKVQHADTTRSAFLRWRSQLHELDAGVNIWEKHAYPNPPVMAMILTPFMYLPPAVGSSLWFIVKSVLTIAAILGILSLLDSAQGVSGSTVTGAGFPLWAKVVAVLLTLRPIEGDLLHGNVNLLILFLVVATLIAFCQRRDGLAGFLLGLSIACKLTPALFLFYFAYQRAWKALLGTSAALLVFGLLVPSLYFGWHNNLTYLDCWRRQMISPYAAGVVSSEHKNQSLPGVLSRLLTDQPSYSDYAGDRRIVIHQHNIAALDPRVVQGIVVVCIVLFAGGVLLFCRTSLADRPPLPITAEFGVIVLGMLLFCERTWKHHCVTLLVPFAVCSYCISSPTYSRATRLCVGVLTTVSAGLILATSTGVIDSDVDTSMQIGKLAQVYGAYVWAFLALLACMFVVLRKTNTTPRSSGVG